MNFIEVRADGVRGVAAINIDQIVSIFPTLKGGVHITLTRGEYEISNCTVQEITQLIREANSERN